MYMTDLAAVTDVSTYLTYALAAPLGIPAVLILVDQWRFPLRIIIHISAILTIFLFAGFYCVYHVFGVTESTLMVVALVTPVICWLGFILCCQFRDGRLLFSTVTALLLAFVTETFASMLTPHNSLLWLLYKIGFTLLEVLLLLLFARKPFLWMLKSVDTSWVKMSLVPLSLLFFLLLYYIFPMLYYGIYQDPLPTILLCITMLLIYMSQYGLARTITAQNRMQNDIDLLNTQMRFMEQQSKIMQVNDHDNRTFRHNLRHYMDMLQGCTAANSASGVQEILDNMEANFHQLHGHYGLQNYTGQPVIDSILSFSAQQAQLVKTKFSVQVVLPPKIKSDIVQLAVVLSNALENALNACQNIPEGQPREVVVLGEVQKGQLYLSVKNTYTGVIHFDPETGNPYTNKKNHGYGTQTMVAFAQEYDALLDFRTKDNWFYFSLLL